MIRTFRIKIIIINKVSLIIIAINQISITKAFKGHIMRMVYGVSIKAVTSVSKSFFVHFCCRCFKANVLADLQQCSVNFIGNILQENY